ncbi:MAG: J domain-containing protein [Thermodesulfobacteriota bacterium]
MLPYYFILNVSEDATDEEIRNSYLRLVKQYTPEKDPVRFQQVTEAYEALQDRRRRILGKIFGGLSIKEPEGALLTLAASRPPIRRPVSLKTLFDAENAD